MWLAVVFKRDLDKPACVSLQASTPEHPWWRCPLALAGVCLLLAVVWEGVKGLGGDPWRVTVGTPTPIHVQFTPPFAFASDLNMPHLWDIAAALLQPAQRHGPPLGAIMQQAAWFRFDNAWAAIMLAMALGMAMYLIILGLERLVMPWHASVRHAAA
jgi:hypothetical protein